MGGAEGLIWLFGVLSMLQLKPWSARGASHHPAFMGNCYSHVFSLIYQVNEFSIKEMRTWGQSKELGGRGSARYPTPMVKRFSTDCLPAIESYCTESQLVFCQTSTTELLCESMWIAFR